MKAGFGQPTSQRFVVDAIADRQSPRRPGDRLGRRHQLHGRSDVGGQHHRYRVTGAARAELLQHLQPLGKIGITNGVRGSVRCTQRHRSRLLDAKGGAVTGDDIGIRGLRDDHQHVGCVPGQRRGQQRPNAPEHPVKRIALADRPLREPIRHSCGSVEQRRQIGQLPQFPGDGSGGLALLGFAHRRFLGGTERHVVLLASHGARQKGMDLPELRPVEPRSSSGGSRKLPDFPIKPPPAELHNATPTTAPSTRPHC